MSALTRLVYEMIGGDCKVVEGDCFKYIYGENTICINPNESYMDNMEWKSFLMREYGFKLTPRNWFIMSILHELGHHYTLCYFTPEEVFKSQTEPETEIDHYLEPVEKIATEWAISYYDMANMGKWFPKLYKAML